MTLVSPSLSTTIGLDDVYYVIGGILDPGAPVSQMYFVITRVCTYLRDILLDEHIRSVQTIQGCDLR